MSLILPANSLTGGYEIANSLRFDGGSSDSLTRTASSGNRKTYTFSAWLKRTKLSVAGVTGDRIFSGYVDGSNWTTLYFGADDRLQLYQWSSGTPNVAPSRLFRDVSAWYHIILAVDTTQATSSDRVKMYVNGIQETSFNSSNYPTLNQDTNINTLGSTFYIGLDPNDDCNMYMSETYFIDGQQLTPTDFGEFDQDTGIWKPIKYTGTYGTNGFYLDFENSGSLGADQSGNGNNFTVNNLTSIDQTTDTPTNNFSTGNPLSTSIAFTEGNLNVTGATNFKNTFPVVKGKWYCELKINSTNIYYPAFGIGQIGVNATDNPSATNFPGLNFANSIGLQKSGDLYRNTSTLTSVSSFAQNDIVGMALDLDSGTKTLKFYKNGTLVTSVDLIETASEPYIFMTYGSGANPGDCSFNFGNPTYSANSYTDGAGYGNFSYAVPSGYYSLCTKNLAEFG